ncbi:pirin family protein [Pseudonocardia humida]|uniref:Pirin family protein n=1 Tax=Pseudonocardia humida TaxID=2800819 RepID=A0ABT1A934_9PSEU|nr:pirin-like bicupin family protein [Pseudonocardia humida]MCO1659527.1 pirin family protein [Pseudonocardia humida]
MDAADAGTGARVRRAADRPRTTTGWSDSRHSFSFGAHYDPLNTHFALLVAHNDDVVSAGTGYDTHPHRDMEIVTWVLEGALVHRDSAGNSGVIGPGLAQRLSAGSGVLHSEHADGPRHDPGSGPPRATRFVQMWVLPDTTGGTPDYEQRDVTGALGAGDLVVVASGMPRYADRRATSIRQRHAALHAARQRPGGRVALPQAPSAHLYVARGSVDLEGVGTLSTGDAARVTGADGQRVVAGADGAEVLVWEMHATLADLGPS